MCLLLLAPVLADQNPAGPHFQPTDTRLLPAAGWSERPFAREAGESSADLVVIINQQFYHFLRPAVAGFARKNGVNILVKKGTCGLAAGAVLNKSAEIVSFCCPPGEVDRLPGLSFHTLGIYPVSILVHPDNPVDELSWQQVQNIFQGRIRRWSEVGGTEEKILPVARLHCRHRPGHWRLLLDNQELFSIHTREVGSIEDVYGLVGEHPEAISFEIDDGYYSRHTKGVWIEGMDPMDLDHLRSGKYPFYRVLNLTLWDAEKISSEQSRQLYAKLATYVERHGREVGMIPAGELRASGWRFAGDELIGLPRTEN